MAVKFWIPTTTTNMDGFKHFAKNNIDSTYLWSYQRKRWSAFHNRNPYKKNWRKAEPKRVGNFEGFEVFEELMMNEIGLYKFDLLIESSYSA